MSKIVAVHSFRGGTGKSNTTANVAAQLAAGGARVAIVDTDIQSPGIHVLFGMDERPSPTLNDVVWGKARIVDAAHDVTARVTQHAPVAEGGALYLVPSSIRPGDIARVLRDGYDVATLNDALRELGRELKLDYLFIDTHPGMNEETLLSMTIGDVLIIILRPDRQDFQGTAVTVDVARRLDVPHLFLVLNKVPEGIDHDDLRAQMTAAYGAETIAILPLSEIMVRNASADLVAIAVPDHPWSAQIRAIAARVAGA
ncbi:MAG: MinD/ParA family protein [Chloroflexota bacterium]